MGADMTPGTRRRPRALLPRCAPWFLAALVASSAAFGAPSRKPKKPVVDVVQGEVVELSCYLTDGRKKGAEHEACCREGIQAGQPVGILRSTGTVVLALGKDMKPANEMLAPWAARKVRVSGKIVKRAQMTAIVIEKIEEAPAEKSRKKPPRK